MTHGHTALGALVLLLAVSAQAAPSGDGQGMPGRLLSDGELSQVHAAGLAEVGTSLPTPGIEAAALRSWRGLQEQAGQAERQQQALDRLQFATSTLQLSGTVMRTVAATGLATPVAPLMLPMIAMPFPFFMPIPPSTPDKHDQGPGGH